jgi:hypothetical protein
VDVDVTTPEGRVRAVTRDLGLQGAWLELRARLHLGDRLLLQLHLPTRAEPVVTDAQVRWLVPQLDDLVRCDVRFVGLRSPEAWAVCKLLGPLSPASPR